MADYLLKEDGDRLLQENGDSILLAALAKTIEAYRRLVVRGRRIFHAAVPRRR